MHDSFVGDGQVGAIARSFQWGPFILVYLDDSLLHVLSLLSKHRLKVVQVAGQFYLHVKGYITQRTTLQLPLQFSELVLGFDKIIEKDSVRSTPLDKSAIYEEATI